MTGAKENLPGGAGREASTGKSNNHAKPIVSAPDNDEQEFPRNIPAAAVIADLRRYAESVGLILTARCVRCGAPLFAPKSLSVRLGPACRKALSTGAK